MHHHLQCFFFLLLLSSCSVDTTKCSPPQRETVAMQADIRQGDSSPSTNWRNDPISPSRARHRDVGIHLFLFGVRSRQVKEETFADSNPFSPSSWVGCIPLAIALAAAGR